MAKILIACEESQATTRAFRELGHEAFSCDLLPCSGGNPEWHFQCDIFEVINPGDRDLPFNERRPHPKYPNRRQDMLDSVDFVKALYNADIKHIAIENPVGLLSSRWRKPDQIVQPYMFGDEATKTTCLWLKNLPLLLPTNIVGKGERTVFASGKSHPKWYADALKNAKTKEERQTLRSKTFPGMAQAFAEQWGDIF